MITRLCELTIMSHGHGALQYRVESIFSSNKSSFFFWKIKVEVAKMEPGAGVPGVWVKDCLVLRSKRPTAINKMAASAEEIVLGMKLLAVVFFRFCLFLIKEKRPPFELHLIDHAYLRNRAHKQICGW